MTTLERKCSVAEDAAARVSRHSPPQRPPWFEQLVFHVRPLTQAFARCTQCIYRVDPHPKLTVNCYHQPKITTGQQYLAQWLVGPRIQAWVSCLEIQERNYHLKVEFWKKAMHEVPADSLLGESYAIQPMPVMPADHATGHASLVTLAAEAPYRTSAALDMSRLESLLAAKKSAAEDHI